MNMGSNFWKLVKDAGIHAIVETHLPWSMVGLENKTIHLSIAPVVANSEGIRDKQIELFKKNMLPSLLQIVNRAILASNPELDTPILNNLPGKKQLLDLGIKNILEIIINLKLDCISPRNVAIFEEVTGIYQWNYFNNTLARDWITNSPTKQTLLETGSVPTLPSCTRVGIAYNLSQKEVIKITESMWYMIINRHEQAKQRKN